VVLWPELFSRDFYIVMDRAFSTSRYLWLGSSAGIGIEDMVFCWSNIVRSLLFITSSLYESFTTSSLVRFEWCLLRKLFF